MVTALAWRKLSPRLAFGVGGWTVIEAAAVILTLWYLRFFILPFASTAAASPLPHASIWLAAAGSFPVFALLIFVLASSRGIGAKLLASPPMVFLGEISYSVYLLQYILLQVLRGQFIPSLPEFWRFPVFLALLVAGSALLYFLIERPARRSIVWLFSPRDQGAERIADTTRARVQAPAAILAASTSRMG
jgi:peptidoglycan/LPS O-acetylase OafA/YrhL